jgi:GNAT superfamily N-acetyltransferase
MKSLSVRELKSNEMLSALRISYSAFNRDVPDDIGDEVILLNDLIDHEIASFLIAECDSELCGIGGLFNFGEISTIGYMGVLSPYRSQGLGTRIFTKLFEKSLQKNIKSIVLYASKLGRPIYEKFGFVPSFHAQKFTLPLSIIENELNTSDFEVLDSIPLWIAKLDQEVMGFDRQEYLNILIKHGSRILSFKKRGFALILKARVGPIIADSSDLALKFIQKSGQMGGNNLIIPKHDYFSDKMLKNLNLQKIENSNVKMTYGKKLNQNLKKLFVIGTFAKL